MNCKSRHSGDSRNPFIVFFIGKIKREQKWTPGQARGDEGAARGDDGAARGDEGAVPGDEGAVRVTKVMGYGSSTALGACQPSALCSAMTVVPIPPRTLKIAVKRIKRGAVAFTRSSRISLVTAS